MMEGGGGQHIRQYTICFFFVSKRLHLTSRQASMAQAQAGRGEARRIQLMYTTGSFETAVLGTIANYMYLEQSTASSLSKISLDIPIPYLSPLAPLSR